MQQEKVSNTAKESSSEDQVRLRFDIPDIKEILKTGAQFGHQAKRWNPKMRDYIFEKRGNIHIIDLSKTIPLLEKALKFLVKASAKGRILFVSTKRQAADIVKEEAKRAGAYYIVYRWPGGLFTNFKMIRKSLKKLEKLEEDFEKGIEGRTKYEVSVMKKEWMRLNNLYGGIKTMDRKPKAIVVVDQNYEKNAVKEAQQVGVPIISIIDTNCDPDGINYPVPANDDSIKSIKLFVHLFADAVLQGNVGKGVFHDEKDYSKVEVKIIKPVLEKKEEEAKIVFEAEKEDNEKIIPKKSRKRKKDAKDEKEIGLLGRARSKARAAKIKKVSNKGEKPKSKQKSKAIIEGESILNGKRKQNKR